MLTQNAQTLRNNTEIPITIAEYERYKASKLYFDTVALTHVLLKVAVSDFMIRKFMIMNVLFGEIGNILKLQKREFILTSQWEYPFYYILDEFKQLYRQINWKKSLLTLKYKPQCIIDYSLSIDNEWELNQYQEFLRISNYPMIVTMLTTDLDINMIIKIFADNNYEYRDDYIKESQSLLNNKIQSYNLDQLFIMTYKPQPIKKEIDDAGSSTTP